MSNSSGDAFLPVLRLSAKPIDLFPHRRRKIVHLRLRQTGKNLKAHFQVFAGTGTRVEKNKPPPSQLAIPRAAGVEPLRADLDAHLSENLNDYVKLGALIHPIRSLSSAKPLPTDISSRRAYAAEAIHIMPDDNVTPPRDDIDLVPEIQRQFSLLEERFGQLKTGVRQAMQLSTLGAATAVWAHELNNLVTPMLSYAQYALAQDDVDLMKKALRVTVTNAKTVTVMSDRILGLSAQKTSPTPQAVNIAAVIEQATACLGRDLAKDGITLAVEVADDLEAWVDPHNLQQVLFNLILNARDAMVKSHGGRLSIRATVDGNRQAVIRIKDTGDGIPPDQLDKVFQPFTSTKPAERNGHMRCGGVGLSLSRELVEECNGRIEVQSKPQVGTTFTILLPSKA